MSLDTIRLSQEAKDKLVWLKRWTGLKQWNVLCRWAVCQSLAEPSPPPRAKIPADSSVEMTWKTFGGEFREVYLALLKERVRRDGLEMTEEVLANEFRLHLHRGIGYLAAKDAVRSIADLVGRAALGDAPAESAPEEDATRDRPVPSNGGEEPTTCA